MISLSGKLCRSTLNYSTKLRLKTQSDSKVYLTNSENSTKPQQNGRRDELFSLPTNFQRNLLNRWQFRPAAFVIRSFATSPDDEKAKKDGGTSKKTVVDKDVRPKTQIRRIDDDSVINQVLLEKYRVPEPTTTAEKVKEGVKDAYYFTAFAVAVVVTGGLLFYVFRDLFSSKSPTRVYGRALKIVKVDPRVEEALGTPIKGFGEETRRGRRRDVAHAEYVKDGVNYMRVKFYVQGPQGRGTVRLEVKENEFGKFDFRYLLLELETIPMKTIILIDDR